jgi:hypothetical protein
MGGYRNVEELQERERKNNANIPCAVARPSNTAPRRIMIIQHLDPVLSIIVRCWCLRSLLS